MKELIQKDFVQAFKEKDEIAKSALSSLKAEITKLEKAKAGQDVDDEAVIKIIASSIKQRQQSVDQFREGGREDLAQKEEAEITILKAYMPQQMSEEEVEAAVREIVSSSSEIVTNPQALVGKTMGAFNKKFPGRADMTIVKEVVTRVIN